MLQKVNAGIRWVVDDLMETVVEDSKAAYCTQAQRLKTAEEVNLTAQPI